MSVLVACEFSGVVREAFRKYGIEAYSNDLIESLDNSPYHIQGDCADVIRSRQWDIIIMHPPCTALAASGNRWYAEGKAKHQERLDAITWTCELFEIAKQHADIGVCMENPVGVLPMPASQYIQPWQFGHGETKRTGLWLHNLPLLTPTNIVDGREQKVWLMGETKDRWVKRSITYEGIAEAFASQWGGLIPQ